MATPARFDEATFEKLLRRIGVELPRSKARKLDAVMRGLVSRLRHDRVLDENSRRFAAASVVDARQAIADASVGMGNDHVPLRVDRGFPPMEPPLVFVEAAHVPQPLHEWEAACDPAHQTSMRSPTLLDVIRSVGARLGGVDVRQRDGFVLVECNGQRGVVCYESAPESAPLVQDRREAVRFVARHATVPCVLFHVGMLGDILEEEPLVVFARDRTPVGLSEYASRIASVGPERASECKSFAGLIDSPQLDVRVNYATGVLEHGNGGVALLVARPEPRAPHFRLAASTRGEVESHPLEPSAFADQVALKGPPGLPWMMNEWPPSSVRVVRRRAKQWALSVTDPDDALVLNRHIHPSVEEDGALLFRFRT